MPAHEPAALLVARSRIRCEVVASAEEEAIHHEIRAAVFVTEQGLFSGSDVDEHDAEPSTLKVLAYYHDRPAGTVRLYPLDPEGARWKGDRLAVLGPYRRHHLGGPLVRYATKSAAARGGTEMLAHVQIPNVAFFERLGWARAGGTERYVGQEHQPMTIALSL